MDSEKTKKRAAAQVVLIEATEELERAAQREHTARADHTATRNNLDEAKKKFIEAKTAFFALLPNPEKL